jgi:hypothetical protein
MIAIPGDMLAAMKTRPEAEWKHFFQLLALDKALQIEGAQSAEDLIRIQAALKQIRTLEQFFITQMKRGTGQP